MRYVASDSQPAEIFVTNFEAVNYQALQRMPEERRYPILLAFLNQSLIEITDETMEIFDRCLWDCYNGAKNDLEALKKDVYKSSNDKLILLREVGKLVLDPEIEDPELRESIFAYMAPERLKEIIDQKLSGQRMINISPFYQRAIPTYSNLCRNFWKASYSNRILKRMYCLTR